MSLENLIERFASERGRLPFIEHAELGIKAELMEMFTHELQAKAVQCTDARRIEQCELLRQMFVRGLRAVTRQQFLAQSAAHFRRRRFGEGDQQDVLQR